MTASCCVRSFASKSFVLIFATLQMLTSASAAVQVIEGYAYRGASYDVTNPADSKPTPAHNLTAGNVYVSDLLITSQSTNATIGEALGYCVVLRNGGPNMRQLTLQLPSGTVQVRRLSKSSDLSHTQCSVA